MTDIQYSTAETQKTPLILPGDYQEATTIDPLGPKAQGRVDKYLELTNQVVTGVRPVVEQHNGEKWYTEQLHTMSQQGYITEEAGAYIQYPVIQRSLGHNPTAHYLIEAKKAIEEALSPAVKGSVRIAGTGFAHKSGIGQRKTRWAHKMTIAPAGDLNTLKEIVDIIDEKVRERGNNIEQGSQAHHERDYPLIIENSTIGSNGSNDGYWDKLLRGIKILDYNDKKREAGKDQREYVNLHDLAAVYGIYITKNREETLQQAEHLAKALPTPELKKTDKPLVPDNSTIYVATGNPKKFDDLYRIYKAQGVNVRIRPIYELTDTYVSPKETSKTYEGNVAEKIHAALDAWEMMDVATRTERLDKIAADCKIPRSKVEEHIFILGEDSGFEFCKPGVVQDHRFDDVRQKLDPSAPFPGVETGPTIFGNHGVQEFFRKAAVVIPEDERDILTTSVLALAPLKQKEPRNRQMYMMAAEEHGKFLAAPQPATQVVEIDNFLVPKIETDELKNGVPGAEDKTEAELGEKYRCHHSIRAQVWKALASEAGIHVGGTGIVDDYAKDFVVGVVAGEGFKRSTDRLQNTVYKDGFGVITLPERQDTAADVQTKILAKADGIVLAFDPARAQQDFWQNLYTVMSMIVGEQTHDKYKFRKPLKLINPKHEGKGAFDDLEELIHDFHHLGTVSEDPGTLYQSVSSIDEAIKQLENDRLHYRRMVIPAYATAERNEIDGLPSKKDFNVAIFCSATNENTKYHDDAHDLAKGLIEADFGLVTGGGLYSSMGAITKVADAMHRAYNGHHSASNVPHIMIGGEGDASGNVQQFLLARNIYERMEFMMDNANAFVIAPGGTGTVQEMALLALLKKRAVEDGNDAYANQKMGGKDIIVLNTQIPYANGNRGFYDKLLDIIPEGDLEKLGIHVVKTVEQANTKLQELRNEKHLDEKQLPHPAKWGTRERPAPMALQSR